MSISSAENEMTSGDESEYTRYCQTKRWSIPPTKYNSAQIFEMPFHTGIESDFKKR